MIETKKISDIPEIICTKFQLSSVIFGRNMAKYIPRESKNVPQVVISIKPVHGAHFLTYTVGLQIR